MARKQQAEGADVEAKLRALDDTADCTTLTRFLSDRHYRVIARAATLAGERLCYALEAELIGAFRRLAERDGKADPGCLAKGAIARALVALDCLDAELWQQGLGLTQREPVWGGSVDTAVDVRASCALGLAASGEPRALIALVSLLADPEHRARIGAARAIACTAPLAAEAVLRLKVHQGDPEPEVIGECLRGLLAVAPDTAPAFVAALLDGPDPALVELAALALGESRLDAAVALLRARWEAEPFRRPAHRVLLRAAALARSESALNWLLGLIAEADARTAGFLIEELAAYRGNARLRAQVAERVAARADARLAALFDASFGAPG